MNWWDGVYRILTLFELIGKNTELKGKVLKISRVISPTSQEVNRYDLEWELQ